MTVRRLAAAYLATGAALSVWWARYDGKPVTPAYLAVGSALWPLGVTAYVTSPMLDTDDEETPTMLTRLLSKFSRVQAHAISVKNVPGCSATLKESNPKEMYLKYNVKCTLKSSDPAGHDVKVRFDYWAINEKSSVDNLDVNCSCSCPAHSCVISRPMTPTPPRAWAWRESPAEVCHTVLCCAVLCWGCDDAPPWPCDGTPLKCVFSC